jgi:DNA-binding MarR family transcriptional regulator
MSDAPFDKAEFETLSNFRYQLRCFLRLSEQLTRRAGVTNLQYLLLLHIKGFAQRDWASITELAERLQASHHGTVALVSRCEKIGLVARRAGRSDGRQVEVHLTQKGNRLVDRLARQHRDELVRLEGIFAVPGKQDLTRTTPD